MFTKNDLTKAQACFEKAMALSSTLYSEAAHALCCVLRMQGKAEAVEKLLADVDNLSKAETWTYAFRGIASFERGQYVLAIEAFQNAHRFGQLSKRPAMKADTPTLHESAAVSESANAAEFKRLLGINGQLRSTVVLWQHLTLCYAAIKRQGAAIKCLERAFSELAAQLVLQPGDGDLVGEHELISVIDQLLLPTLQRRLVLKS